MSARYVTWVGADEATVDLARGEGEAITATVQAVEEGGAVGRGTVDIGLEILARDAHGGYRVRHPDGRVVAARVVRGKDGKATVVLGGARIQVTAMPERDAWLGGGQAAGQEGAVTVSMPGAVVKVLVVVGDEVEEGQPVLIIEAMKMENEVKAGMGGFVEAIHVKEGDAVEADVVLLEIGEA